MVLLFHTITIITVSGTDPRHLDFKIHHKSLSLLRVGSTSSLKPHKIFPYDSLVVISI